jgi:hypothetical protein
MAEAAGLEAISALSRNFALPCKNMHLQPLTKRTENKDAQQRAATCSFCVMHCHAMCLATDTIRFARKYRFYRETSLMLRIDDDVAIIGFWPSGQVSPVLAF